MVVHPVIIAGAGPTGLSAALFLTEKNVPVLVIDQHDKPFADPRAATFHPPTMEMLAPSGITDLLHENGIIVDSWQMRDRTKGLVAEFNLGALANDTKYPYRLQCEQHKLCDMLRAKLQMRDNCTFSRGENVADVVQFDDFVEITTNKSTYRAQYLLGADGGRSVVRKSQDIAFEGFSYPERFLVITHTYDFEEEGYALSCYVSDPEEWCAIFKVPGDRPEGLWRLVFPTNPDESDEDLLCLDYAAKRLKPFLPREKPYEIVHTNLYNVHQRVASTYLKGRVLLAGDAAHINNPLGGMGMNFGIHDAHSLADKLAKVINDSANEDLLELYDRQRRSVAKTVLQRLTIDNKKALEEKDDVALRKRQQYLKRAAADPEEARDYLLRTAMFEGLQAAAEVK